MSRVVLARALARSQHGPEALSAVAAVGAFLAIAGLQTVPTLDHGYPLHLYTLGPGTIAAVCSVAAGSKVSELAIASGCRLEIFRALWCILLAAACGLLVWPAAAAMHRSGEIVGSTVLLVDLTFAAYAIVGSHAWAVGAINTIAAMAAPRSLGDSDPITAWLTSFGPSYAWTVIAGGTVVCALAYASAARRQPLLKA